MISVFGFFGPGPPPEYSRKNHAGQSYVRAFAGPYDPESVFDAETGVGNVLVYDPTLTPSGADNVIDGFGLFETDDPTTGRQSFTYSEYDITLRAWIVVEGVPDGITRTYWIRNLSPVETTPIPPQTWWTNVAIQPVILGNYVNDGDDAETALVYTVALPPGLSIATVAYPELGRTVQQIQGTPTAESAGSLAISVEDIADASINLTPVAYTIGAGVLVPTVDTTAIYITEGLEQFGNAGLAVIDVVATDQPGVGVGFIYDQTPPGGTYVAPGTSAVLFVSGVEVPDVDDPEISRAMATASLLAVGLTVSVETQTSLSVSPGYVISQSPQANEIVAPGSLVTIIVAAGGGADRGGGGFYPIKREKKRRQKFDDDADEREQRRREIEEAMEAARIAAEIRAREAEEAAKQRAIPNVNRITQLPARFRGRK